MLEAKTRWIMQETDEDAVQQLSNEMHISELTARLLVNRGIRTVAEAQPFLNVTETAYHDPFLLTGMSRAVERIKAAIKQGEKLLIYGDYDADGITSTALMVNVLRAMKGDFLTYIPNRFTEGYGPNEAAFRWAKQQGVSVIITVDTGIASLYEAEVASDLQIDLIITDHHEPQSELPDAYAIINPKQAGCSYPFKELAGVGVAYKLAHALLGEASANELLDLAAIGTIADLVPLQGENRKIAIEGMQLLSKRDRLGIRALVEVSGITDQEISAGQIGFALAPRLNAAGRLQTAKPALQLLISNDEEEAMGAAEEIDQLNKQRQAIATEITNEAITIVEETYKSDRVIVLAQEGWNPGIVGIVASRLVERYYRPTIILAIDSKENEASGSGRSIAGFHLFNQLSACDDLLLHYGGHPMAAGLTMSPTNIGELRKRLNQVAATQLRTEDFIPQTVLDATCTLEEATIETIEEISQLVPFGIGNPEPLFLFEEKTISQLRKIGSRKDHLKFQLEKNETRLEGIGFSCGSLFHELNNESFVSAVGKLSINEWNGFRKPQLMLTDIAVTEWQLFDLRGTQTVQRELAKLPKEKIALVSFRKETRQVLQLDLSEIEHVLLSEGEIPRLTKPYIFLLDLPYSKKQLENLLTTAPTLERIYAVFYHSENHFFTALPTRTQFKHFYALLRQRMTCSLKDAKSWATRNNGKSEAIEFMAQVFSELGFVTIKNGIITFIENPQKRDLKESETYEQKLHMIEIERKFLYSSYKELKEHLFAHLSHRVNNEEATV